MIYVDFISSCKCHNNCCNNKCGCMKNSLPCSFWCKCSIDCSNKSLLFDDSKEADILFFDLETTGLSSDAKIIELSFFYPATEVWYSSLVQQHNVSNFILELTGITQKELSTANSWNIVSTELCQWLLSLSSKKYLFLLGHNATSYDENILSKQLDIVKQKLPENCFFEDTIRIFKKMVPKNLLPLDIILYIYWKIFVYNILKK